jgi:hypothetical protein
MDPVINIVHAESATTSSFEVINTLDARRSSHRVAIMAHIGRYSEHIFSVRYEELRG